MTINLPEGAANIITALEKNGFEAYVVGGCVRDSLLWRKPKDWDICTNAIPKQVEECFTADVKIIETGLQHGTITIMVNNVPYEVTTYRIDGEYLDNRHPKKVKFINSLKEDLRRRDFTINAMAYNPKSGLIDYFDGYKDLEKNLIECVGDPDERFNEDALRIMRALRFASTYDFNIAEATQLSIRQYKNLLEHIAAERINTEMCKLLCGKGVAQVLSDYVDIICVFIPEITPMIGFTQNNPYHCFDVWQHTVQSVVNAPNDIVLRLTMLFHDIAKPSYYTVDETGIGHFYRHSQYSSKIASEILKRLKFDNNTIIQVKELILYHDVELQLGNKNIKRWLNKIGEYRLRQLIQVQIADIIAQSPDYSEERLSLLHAISSCIDSIMEQQQCFTLKDLAVSGRDLMSVGILEGVQIGITLNRLMDMVIDEQIENDKVKLLAEVTPNKR